jgi:hypothetical protein
MKCWIVRQHIVLEWEVEAESRKDALARPITATRRIDRGVTATPAPPADAVEIRKGRRKRT